MGLQEKYSELINLATDLGVENLQVIEQNSVLYIDGNANSAADKDSAASFVISSLSSR